MSSEKKVIEYDEDDSVKFIQTHLPKDMQGKFSDDDINYIVDIIYEYYEEKGFLDEADDDNEIEINEDELITYVTDTVKKENECAFDRVEVGAIVLGELAYCDSLNIFE